MSISELRVAITAADYDSLIRFYRDGLGLEPGDTWADHGNGQLFYSGKAVIEILDKEHATHVDAIEVGQSTSGKIRFAFQVPDIQDAIENALNYGATLVNGPVRTPWNDLNARIESPDGLQITLFQVIEAE